MAMNLYACTFKWLLNKINKRIKGTESFSSIGVLDIFGFENFEVSDYEARKLHFLKPLRGFHTGQEFRFDAVEHLAIRVRCFSEILFILYVTSLSSLTSSSSL